jgi:hypothetical protein
MPASDPFNMATGPTSINEYAPWQLAAGFGGGTNTNNAYGGVPAPVSPAAAPASSIAGNLSNVGNLYALAQGAGAASGAGGAANLNTALPGGQAGLESELGLANQELTGQLPANVVQQIEQTAAERGVSTGDIGSPNDNAALLRLIGQNSEQLQQQGVSNLTSAIGSAPVGPQFNINSQLGTPSEAGQQLNYNAELGAAPNPEAAAMANLTALQSGAASGGGSGPGLPGGGSAATVPTINLGGGAGGTILAYGPGGGPGVGYPYTSSTQDTGPGTAGPGAPGESAGPNPANLIPNGDGTYTDYTTGQTYDSSGYPVGTQQQAAYAGGGGGDEDEGND